MTVITGMSVRDVRFPTSQDLDGSDAMNPDPDYSAAYVLLSTDDSAGLEGHGFCFTIGRGNEIVVSAIRSFEGFIVGRHVESLLRDLGDLSREMLGDSQLRWLGPEKGVVHMAAAAILNAAWDLAAKRAGKPVWRLLADLSADELADLIDYRHISDALTREEAVEIFARGAAGVDERVAEMLEHGYPAYTTSPGWLGYSDEKMRRLCGEAVEQGFDAVKLKVGADPEDDRRRIRIAREALGPDVVLMVDANQTWDVNEAIEWIRGLGDSELGWVEEPTSPDDILGHARIRSAISPVPVATGEHVHNRIMFKQLFQAGAIDVCQLDTCRLASINEILAVLAMAAKFGVRVCPHTGGVGLCELAQHISLFDYVRVSASLDRRRLEYVDHLHEHFVDPVVIDNGRYRAPTAPGYSSEIYPLSRERYEFPTGAEWTVALAAVFAQP